MGPSPKKYNKKQPVPHGPHSVVTLGDIDADLSPILPRLRMDSSHLHHISFVMHISVESSTPRVLPCLDVAGSYV